MQRLFPKNELAILTVHTPELMHEYDGQLLREKVTSLKLKFPVYIDNSHDYWNALRAEAWPSIYLIDKSGMIRYIFIGETHNYFAQARAIKSVINTLLGEQSNRTELDE